MGIGVWQIVIILILVLVIFGAGKLPRVMGDMGSGMRNFKNGLKGEDEPADTDNDKAEKISNLIKLNNSQI